MLTIFKVGVLGSWGGAEDGTGWELAVCPSLYMQARVTVKASCQIKGLSRGQCLSLCWGLERTRAGLDTQLFLAAAPDTAASNKSACVGVCFCVCVNICLVGVDPVCAHIQLPICASKRENMYVQIGMAPLISPLGDEG